jgi:2-polyprenyl-3-methyl-5-hydroxy-6-metoxy-1,4-benzoquinol methylase
MDRIPLQRRSGSQDRDFGSGPGLYAARLAQRQADVTGLDFSERSLSMPRKSQPGMSIYPYVNQNYLEFETDDHFHLFL